MSIGMILLVVLALLILFGVLQRVLDRMALTDRQALVCVAAIFIGGWLPDITLGAVTVNLGGAFIPLLVCAYLLIRCASGKERARCLIATGLATASIYAIGHFFPADPVAMPFDPMFLYGPCAGVIAWFLGRSRRGAFIAGILGVILSDLLVGVVNWQNMVDQAVHLGTAGALDASILSGVGAVLTCELIGELTERIFTGRASSPSEDGAIKGGHRA